MKTFKKSLSFILVFVLLVGTCFALGACGASEPSKENAPSIETTQPVEDNNNTQTNDGETKPNDTEGGSENSETVTSPNEETTKPSTETTVPNSDVTEPDSEDATKPNEETTKPNDNNSNSNNPSDPSSRPTVTIDGQEKPQNGNSGNTKPNGSTDTTVDPNANANQTLDATHFANYETFYSSVESEGYVLESIEEKIKYDKAKCDCNIVYSGNGRSGSLTVKINGKQHTHTWGTYTIFNLGSSILENCPTCGFVKGQNFIYVKLPNANHGHGWSWLDTIVPLPSEDSDCECGCLITGNAYNGSASIIINGKVHQHVWNQPSNRLNESGGSVEPDCTICGFTRYRINKSTDVVTMKCSMFRSKYHSEKLPLLGVAIRPLCDCGFYYSGDASNGYCLTVVDGKSHRHDWGTLDAPNDIIDEYEDRLNDLKDAISDIKNNVTEEGNDDVLKQYNSMQSLKDAWTNPEFGLISCKTCGFVRTKSGFRINCPISGTQHIVQFNHFEIWKP